MPLLPSERVGSLYESGGDGKDLITSDLQLLVPVQIAHQLSFAIVRSHRGPKRKVIRMFQICLNKASHVLTAA
jgi:hypothetical protein